VTTAIRWYQHAEGGSVHGFTHPLHPEIAAQVSAGKLVRVTDPESSGDPDEEIARLRAENAALREQYGVPEPSVPEVGALAGTSDSGTETDDLAGPVDSAVDDDVAGVHVCLECGDPVDRVGRTGPWPQRHQGCK
jgi:hypothetical protein